MTCPYWSPFLTSLDPYVPGEQPRSDQPIIKLNTNENPYGPSPKVQRAIEAELSQNRLQRYPDPDSKALKAVLADHFSLSSDQVFVGNGSDEVLAHAFCALLKQAQPILFPDITYSFYTVYARLYQIDYQQIPLDEQFQIDFESYLRPNGGVLFPNPNAPTGHLHSLSTIEQFVKDNQRINPNGVVIVDEAYIDFGGATAAALVDEYPNVLVTQTLSKSRSLAGLRVGFALGSKGLIAGLERVKNSFNSYPIDRLAAVGAGAAIEDNDYFEQTRSQIVQSRTWLAAQLSDLGFKVLPSAANFLLVEHEARSASELADALRQKNIIVRHLKQQRINNFLRISIGTESELECLVTAFKEILSRDE